MPKVKVLVLGTERSNANNGSSFLRVKYAAADRIEKSSVFFDNGAVTGEIKGKVCEINLEDSVYKGKPSDKITEIDTTEDDPAPYIRRTHLDVEKTMSAIKAELAGDKQIASIVDALFKSEIISSKFRTWPAAKEVHHTFLGGLLEHTFSMMQLAKSIIAVDPAAKGIDEVVVKAAILFHDLGKILEIDYKPGMEPEKSTVGLLLGHISIGDEILCKFCNNLGIKTREGRILNIRHCILSHHGKLEWGSPIVPSTREAILVHQIDMVQVQNEMARETLSGVAPGERAQYNSRLKTEMYNAAERSPE